MAYNERVFLFLGLVKQTLANFCSSKKVRVTGFWEAEENLLTILEEYFIIIIGPKIIFELFKDQRFSEMTEK